jgi:hypothetical protein
LGSLRLLFQACLLIGPRVLREDYLSSTVDEAIAG